MPPYASASPLIKTVHPFTIIGYIPLRFKNQSQLKDGSADLKLRQFDSANGFLGHVKTNTSPE